MVELMCGGCGCNLGVYCWDSELKVFCWECAEDGEEPRLDYHKAP